jgi:hypothetical protein
VVKVAKLQEPAAAALHRSGESVLFAPDDPMWPGHPGSVVFADHRWDLSILGLAANQVAGTAVLNFDRFLKPVLLLGSEGPSERIRLSPIWLVRAKEVIAILLAPTRHTSRGLLDVYRVRESSSSKLKSVLAHVYALAVWATREAVPPDLDRWQQDDLDDAAVPPGGWHYRWTGYFPEVRTVAEQLGAWLDNPENRIPLRASDEFAVHLKSRRGGSWSGEDVNRDLLARMIGVRSGTLREQVDSIVDAAVSRGQTVVGGLCQISSIRWVDGSQRAWIDGIDPALLEPLTHFCRMCCIVFVYMFSGMRDSAVIQSSTPGKRLTASSKR